MAKRGDKFISVKVYCNSKTKQSSVILSKKLTGKIKLKEVKILKTW